MTASPARRQSAASIGERPRFVWMITPVPLMRRRSEEEVDKLEEDIRRVKNKYDQFFAGIQKIPPLQERRNIEIYIYELGKQKMRENARRFRFNQLLSRYNQYRELWGRKIREREEGPLDFRRRAAALSEPEPPRQKSRAAAAVTSPKA